MVNPFDNSAVTRCKSKKSCRLKERGGGKGGRGRAGELDRRERYKLISATRPQPGHSAERVRVEEDAQSLCTMTQRRE